MEQGWDQVGFSGLGSQRSTRLGTCLLQAVSSLSCHPRLSQPWMRPRAQPPQTTLSGGGQGKMFGVEPGQKNPEGMLPKLCPCQIPAPPHTCPVAHFTSSICLQVPGRLPPSLQPPTHLQVSGQKPGVWKGAHTRAGGHEAPPAALQATCSAHNSHPALLPSGRAGVGEGVGKCSYHTHPSP